MSQPLFKNLIGAAPGPHLNYIEIGEGKGATLAAGADRLKLATEGYYMSLTLFSQSAVSIRINKEEIFGPVASMIRVKNYEDAFATASDTEFGLSAGIATTSRKYATHRSSSPR